MSFPIARVGDRPRGVRRTLAAAGATLIALVGLNLMPDARVAEVETGDARAPAPVEGGRPAGTRPGALRLFPAPGPLATGWHNITVKGHPVAVNVPAGGWTSQGSNAARSGGRLAKGDRGTMAGAVIEFWSPDHVYADPCGQAPSPAVGPLADNLVSAIAGLPGVEVTGPVDVAARHGQRVTHLVLDIPEMVACQSRALRLWYDGIAGPRLPAVPGSRILVWIANWGGRDGDATRILVEAETYADANPELSLEIASIVGSMVSNLDAPGPPRLGLDEAARAATLAQVESVCRSATERLAALERRGGDAAAGLEAAIGIADDALANLRAISPPARDADLLQRLLDAFAPPIDVLHEMRAAAVAADEARVDGLRAEYARLARDRDWRVTFDAADWHELAASLRACPATRGG